VFDTFLRPCARRVVRIPDAWLSIDGSILRAREVAVVAQCPDDDVPTVSVEVQGARCEADDRFFVLPVTLTDRSCHRITIFAGEPGSDGSLDFSRVRTQWVSGDGRIPGRAPVSFGALFEPAAVPAAKARRPRAMRSAARKVSPPSRVEGTPAALPGPAPYPTSLDHLDSPAVAQFQSMLESFLQSLLQSLVLQRNVGFSTSQRVSMMPP
jgi:hypothetical protein